MRLAILGAGYVGLVSAACFAELGLQATVVDADAAKIAQLQAGNLPLYEPDLADLTARNVAADRLRFTTDLAAALAGVSVIFIAVGTPSRRGDGHADLIYVEQAARDLARHLPDDAFTAIVTKSTVPVGVSRKLQTLIRAANPRADCAVCANPEFLREGAAIADFMRPARIVVGADDRRAAAALRALYAPLTAQGVALVETTPESAELIKYASNSFLAAKIAFINEMADLCEKTGADIRAVAHGMGLDPRISPYCLQAGPGFGGACFPKDTLALLRTAQDHEVALKLVESVIGSNENRKHAMAARVVAACGGDIAGLTIGILGVTFKAGTDDVRESPALEIIPALQAAGARVRAYDPAGMAAAAAVVPDVDWAKTAEALFPGAAALVIVTDWPEFSALDLAKAKNEMAAAVIIDLRDMIPATAAVALGFRYYPVGRAPHI